MRWLPLLLLLAWPLLGGEEQSTRELLAALSDTDYQVRRKAVLAVEGRCEAELIDRILEIAASDAHPNIRGYATEVLGSLRDPRILPVLAKLAQQAEYGPRTHAYVALGKLGDPRGRKLLLQGLEAGRGLRGYAAKGLGLLGDPRDFQPVARLLLEHPDDPYVADLAPAALERILVPDALEFLRKHFVALPPHARNSATKVLGRHPDQKTREMMELLLETRDRDLRIAAIRVLSDLEDPMSAPALLAHLARQPDERAPVIEALGRSGNPRAVAPLVKALAAEKDLVAKMRLIEALGRLGDKAALKVLLTQIDDTTLLAQPKTISSIWVFPYNTRIHAAATWAILTIRNQKQPFPLADLSNFPTGKPPARIAKDLAAIRKWAGR